MDINSLVNLTSRAWSLPVLAGLHNGLAGRQAALIHATGASRSAFRQTAEHLIELKLLERNPGHGHPLRPEFRLTEQGIQAAQLAAQVARVLPNEAESGAQWGLVRKSWTLPILRATLEPMRFSEIREQLLPITDRALSQSLLRLEQNNWLTRDVDAAARPARAFYQAQGQGRAISELLAP